MRRISKSGVKRKLDIKYIHKDNGIKYLFSRIIY